MIDSALLKMYNKIVQTVCAVPFIEQKCILLEVDKGTNIKTWVNNSQAARGPGFTSGGRASSYLASTWLART